MTSTKKPLWQFSAGQTAAYIKAGDISCEAVMQAHLERATQTQSLNAITTRYDDQAMSEARAADQALASGKAVGPLHGVPVTIKENIDQFGHVTSNGVRDFDELYGTEDAPLVQNFRSAGAIPMGRTNAPELSWRFHTDNELFGATLNPWNKDLSPGGSSGGAASSVAVGAGCIAHGNDLGGSVRGPAYCCGITGLRPTTGRIPFYNSSALGERPITVQLSSAQGPLARNVADVKLGYEAMAGYHNLDTWSLPTFEIDRPLTKRVALVRDPINIGLDPSVDAALDQAAAALTQAGYEVEIATPPSMLDIHLTYMRLMFTEMYLAKKTVVDRFGSGQLRRVLDHYLQLTEPFDLAGYSQALSKRNHYHREWDHFQRRYPIVMTPMITTPPYKAGADMDSVESVEIILDSCSSMSAMNYLDLPCMTVPTQARGLGVPIGVQLIGPRYGELHLLAAAQAVEDTCGCPVEELLQL
ncbi:MAG: indole acetimide hydrolase [Oceanospirillaceae bacterium]|jgi:amidase|nr:indole acetimide hydrolase [Oceanospirillaceae bacterium]MBT6077586.1 indole acetimide hydrolase [Oceanospirillaceae bacterium]